jgi:membrane AbrB-like protein
MTRFPVHSLATLIAGILGGALASWIGWPLPWVIGSLAMVMAVRCCGWRVPDIPHGRKAGQLIVATAIGCHFTVNVMHEVAVHLGAVTMAIAMTLLLALLGIRLLYSWGIGLSTAYFALMPANSTEMIHLARQRGADAGFVAAAHSLRLLLILLGVPLAASFAAPHAIHALAQPVIWGWLLTILPLGLLMAMLFKRLDLPNPWTFGPFLVCAVVVGGADLHMSMPGWLSACGQLLVGCALGVNFDRAFFRRAPAFMLKVLLLLSGSIIATAAVAWLMGEWLDIGWLSLALGMMPGSAPEMSLTAEALNLAVTLVTAMQIIRMILIQAATLPVYRWMEKRCSAARTGEIGERL